MDALSDQIHSVEGECPDAYVNIKTQVTGKVPLLKEVNALNEYRTELSQEIDLQMGKITNRLTFLEQALETRKTSSVSHRP